MARSARLTARIAQQIELFGSSFGLLICGLKVRFLRGSPTLTRFELVSPEGLRPMAPPCGFAIGLDSFAAHHLFYQ